MDKECDIIQIRCVAPSADGARYTFGTIYFASRNVNEKTCNANITRKVKLPPFPIAIFQKL